MNKNKYLEFAQTTFIPMIITLLLGIGFGLLINQNRYDKLKINYDALEETYEGEQQELYQEIKYLKSLITFIVEK